MSDVCMGCGEEYGDCICFKKERKIPDRPIEVSEEMGEA